MNRSWFSNKAVVIFLAISVIAAFATAIQYPFVNLDDFDYVVENKYVASGIHLKNIQWAFTSFHAANWHPVTWISHMIDCQIYGLKPWGHHLSNILLHSINTVLLFSLLNRLTGELWKSVFVAILFAIHPLRVESVVWISERKDVLSTGFLLSALYCYVSFAQSRELKHYFLALAAFALGLMSKPMLVTLPFLLLLLDYWPLRRIANQQASEVATSVRQPPVQTISITRILIEKIPFGVLSIVSSIITVKAQSSSAVISLAELPLSSRAANAIVSYTSYIGKMLWPVNLSVYYPFPSSIPTWKVAGSIILLTAISALALKYTRRYPYLAVGWFWYLVTLIPVIGLVQVGAQSIADRYTYIPCIGLFIAITWGGFEFKEARPTLRPVLTVTSSVLLLTLGIVAYRQVGYWSDSESLYRHALHVTKDNWFAHANLGVALDEQGRFNEALPHFITTVQLNPQYSHSHYSLGISLRRLGRLDEAIKHYQTAVHLEPSFASARNNLANALLARGNTDEAITQFRVLVNLQPTDAKYRSNFADALDKRGLLEEALVQYREALKINPNSAQTHNNLGSIYYRLGNMDKAAGHLSDAIRLDPSLTSAQFYLNYINSQRNRGN